MKKAYYLGCNEKGKEELIGEIMGNKKAAMHIKFLRKLREDISCDSCNNTNYRGIYIINDYNNVLEYYCISCCKDNNLFEKYEDYERFKITSI